MAGLGVADWTPREPYQGYPDGIRALVQKAHEPSKRGTSSHAAQRASREGSADVQGQKHRSNARRKSALGSRAPGPTPTLRPPGGEYRKATDGWYVSEVSQDWLCKPATGIHFHCPTETLWRKAKGGHGFVQVDPGAGLASVAIAALGETEEGQRTLLRACLLSWRRQLHKFDDMDKDLAEGVAAETTIQHLPRMSAPRTADRGDARLATLLEPAVSRLSNFVTDVSDGASLALAAASKSASEAVAQAASHAQAASTPQRAVAREAQTVGRPGSHASSRSSSARSDDASSSSTGSWKPKHGAPALAVRRREPLARSEPSTSASQRKSAAQPSGRYLGAVTLPPKLQR